MQNGDQTPPSDFRPEGKHPARSNERGAEQSRLEGAIVDPQGLGDDMPENKKDEPKVYHSSSAERTYISEATKKSNFATGLMGEFKVVNDALIDVIASESTRVIGSNDRVVIGSWFPPEKEGEGYIQNALDHGGIFFDTGKEVWEGLKDDAIRWQVNQAFLLQQMKRSVPSIELVGDKTIEEVLKEYVSSFLVKEVAFLNKNAPIHGYIRDGNKWIFVGKNKES